MKVYDKPEYTSFVCLTCECFLTPSEEAQHYNECSDCHEKKWRSEKPQFIRLDKNRISCTNGVFLVKHTIIGWCVYLNRVQYMKSGADFKSFKLLKEAKSFAIEDAKRLLKSI